MACRVARRLRDRRSSGVDMKIDASIQRRYMYIICTEYTLRLSMNNSRNILISGASFAGLATAFWMKKAGFNVTVVEFAEGLKKGGTPVNIRNNTVDIVKRMGLFDQIQSNMLNMQETKFISADYSTLR